MLDNQCVRHPARGYIGHFQRFIRVPSMSNEGVPLLAGIDELTFLELCFDVHRLAMDFTPQLRANTDLSNDFETLLLELVRYVT